MVTRTGVQHSEIGELCTRCCIKHIDLSQVMTYMDFGPSLQTLGRKAPELLSLALHGLHLPDGPLLELAHGCPRLRRLHFVGCSQYSPSGLRAFLQAAASLVHLDLSRGNAFAEPLLEWVEERQRHMYPVLDLRLLHPTQYHMHARPSLLHPTD